jgi:hypothetical protein
MSGELEGVCKHCGCTEATPCNLGYREGFLTFCAWVCPGVCSAPACVEKEYKALGHESARGALLCNDGTVLYRQGGSTQRGQVVIDECVPMGEEEVDELFRYFEGRNLTR